MTIIKQGSVVTEPLPAFQDLPHLFVGRQVSTANEEYHLCERCRQPAHSPLHAVNRPHLEQLLTVWEQEAN